MSTPGSSVVGGPSLWTEVRILTQRVLGDTLTTPLTLVVAFLFAAGFVVVNDGLLGGSAAVTEEVGGEYLAFILPAGVLIAAVTSGTSGYLLAQDREDLYLDRLLTMPVSRLAIILAPVLLSAGYAVIQACAMVGLGAIFGVTPVTGVAGALVIVGMASLWGMAVAGYMTATALLFGRLDVTRVADLFAFPLLFLSPLLLPRSDLQGWLQAISTVNPTTYVIEGMRSVMIDGWQASVLLPGVLAGAGFAVLTLGAATVAARRATARR